MLDKRTPLKISPEEKDRSNLPKLPWGVLRNRLSGLVDTAKNGGGQGSRSSTGHHGREWLIELAQMAMPESGLPQEVAEGLFGEFDKDCKKLNNGEKI